ncbi:MAG: hypothetical protein NT029_09365 [Armatimonadetes bacterium]|nr:hypothetical protein [Armatimonadota bacterium]
MIRYAPMVAAAVVLGAAPAWAGPDGILSNEARYGSLPLQFVQSGRSGSYLARGRGYGLAVSQRGAVLTLVRGGGKPGPKAVSFAMRTVGGNPGAVVAASGKLPGTVSSFVGDRSQWRTGMPAYASVRVGQVYPGIDLVYTGNQKQAEYDFVLEPGADPSRIRLALDGLRGSRIEPSGALRMVTRLGDLHKSRPTLYQVVGGKRVQVAGGFRPIPGRAGEYGFRVGSYDRSRRLVIDPVFEWATFSGGAGAETGGGIAVNADGEAYFTGNTASAAYPVSAGSFDVTYNLNIDAFVTKLNASGTAQVYSAFLGGAGPDDGVGITLDDSGDAYVVGRTASPNFPTTAGVVQTAFGGGTTDGFLTKVSPTGASLIYSTYLGGNGDDGLTAVAASSNRAPYVTGYSRSPNYPTTAGAYDTTWNGNYDAVVTVLNPTATVLVASTYIGGAGEDSGMGIGLIDIVPIVSGYTQSPQFPTTQGAFQTARQGPSDAFCTRFPYDLSGVSWSTLVGGGSADVGAGMAIDSGQEPAFTGYTESPDFPVQPTSFQTTLKGTRDAIVVHLSKTGATLKGSTYLGGNGADEARAIVLDPTGYVVAGQTGSNNFPVTAGAAIGVFQGGSDAFVARLSPACDGLPYSTFVGGAALEEGNGLAIDPTGAVYLSGTTASSAFPVTPGAFQTTIGGSSDAYVVKLRTIGLAVVTVTNGAGRPGETVVLKATLRRGRDLAAIAGEELDFSVSGASVGHATTDAAGLASLSYFVSDTLTMGANPVDVVFAGNADYGSASGSGVLAVAPAPTSAYVPDRGQIITLPVALKAYLKRSTDAAWLVGRTVEFTVNGTSVGSAPTDAGGQAVLTWTVTAGAASRVLKGIYTGEVSYLGSTGTATLTCQTVATKVYVVDRLNVKIKTYTVLKAYLYTLASAIIPGKLMTMEVDGTSLGSQVTNSGGYISFGYTVPEGVGAGNRVIKAIWAGDGGYLASSNTGKLGVVQGNLYVWPYVRSGKRGTVHPLRAYVRSLPDYVIQPGKAITFKVNGSVIGSANVAADGWATVNWSIPAGEPTGAHTASADFAGDAWYAAVSASATFNVVP